MNMSLKDSKEKQTVTAGKTFYITECQYKAFTRKKKSKRLHRL